MSFLLFSESAKEERRFLPVQECGWDGNKERPGAGSAASSGSSAPSAPGAGGTRAGKVLGKYHRPGGLSQGGNHKEPPG